MRPRPAIGRKSIPRRAEHGSDDGSGHRGPIGSALGLQPFLGAFLDQYVDECEPLFLVDRFGKQLPIAVIVESRILLTHLTPPRATPQPKCSATCSRAQ